MYNQNSIPIKNGNIQTRGSFHAAPKTMISRYFQNIGESIPVVTPANPVHHRI